MARRPRFVVLDYVKETVESRWNKSVGFGAKAGVVISMNQAVNAGEPERLLGKASQSATHPFISSCTSTSEPLVKRKTMHTRSVENKSRLNAIASTTESHSKEIGDSDESEIGVIVNPFVPGEIS